MTVPATAVTIPRPRIEARLREALERGPVVLVAPAGYGKTAAVAAALAGRTGAVLWHACAPRDADPGRLLVALLRGLRRTLPGAVDALLEDLAAPGDAVEPGRVVAALLAELERLVVEPLVVVLDDAEHLADEPASLAVVDALLDADPGALRLVLASRRRPALRLARRSVAGRLLELDEHDLRFDAAETASLLRRRTGSDPTDDVVATTLAESRGWPLGLALGLDGAAARDRALERYVAEEVLEALDSDDRAALLATAVEDALPPGARTLRQAPDGLLDRTAGLGLAPAPVPGRPGTVAWHPLVRDALLVRWRRERPEAERAALLSALAGDLQAAGRPGEAVDRWLQAGRPDEAVGAMVVAAAESLRLAPATVRGWLDVLPATVRDGADGRWLQARLAAVEGRVRDAAAHYVAALPTLDPDRRDAALMGVMESAYFLGDLAVATPVQALLEEPEALGDRPVALLAAAWLGINRVARGDLVGGAALATRAFAQPAGGFARELEPLLHSHERLPGGGHDALRRRLQEIEAERRAHGFPEWLASIRGFLEMDVGRWDDAAAYAERMVRRADRDDGTQYWRSLGEVQLAWSLAVAGRTRAASTALAPLRDSLFDGWPLCWIDLGLALVASTAGRHAEAAEHADRALRLGAGAPLFLRHLQVEQLAPVLQAAGRTGDALELVQTTIAVLDDRIGVDRGRYHRARLRAHRAALLDAAGRPDEALDDLRAGLAGGPDVVRADWRVLREPLWRALERGALDPRATVAAVDAAHQGGVEVLELAGHPAPTVRAAVAATVGRSGHPSAPARLKALAGDDDPAVRAAARSGADMRASASVPALVVSLFGGFSVRRGRWVVEERTWGRPTVPRLVRFLLVHGRQLVPQDVILEGLWPDRPPGPAKAQLQVAVSRARQVLDPPGTDAAASALAHVDGAYRLALPERDAVDTEAFAAAATAALADDGPARRAALERAAARWTGEPLPEERYAPWADAWRADLTTAYHRVLGALAREQRAVGDEAGVADTARRLVALDPADEAAHRLLMEAYARTGRAALALRQFLVCRRALVDAVGAEPGRVTTELQAAILAGTAV